tara:strand:- start:4505 stop:5242 length:738 start_codon:yes stop_codon:yes gene_type:complete
MARKTFIQEQQKQIAELKKQLEDVKSQSKGNRKEQLVTEESNMKTGHTLQYMNEGISDAMKKMDDGKLERLSLFLKEKGADISTCTDELLKKFQQKEQTVDLSKDNDVKKATATIIPTTTTTTTTTFKPAVKAATNYDEEENQIETQLAEKKKEIAEKQKDLQQLEDQKMQLKKRKREAAKTATKAVKKSKGNMMEVKPKKLTKAKMVMLADLNSVKLSEKTQPKMLKEFRKLVKNGDIKGVVVV